MSTIVKPYLIPTAGDDENDIIALSSHQSNLALLFIEIHRYINAMLFNRGPHYVTLQNCL